MQELKAYTSVDIEEMDNAIVYNTGKLDCTRVYLKTEADAILSGKDKEIAELKDKLQAAEKQTENLINSASSLMLKQDAANDKLDAEIRRLNLKYWNDKADEAAKMKRLIYDGEIRYLDEYCNEKDWRIMYKVWEDEETKCRAKAEEYK